MFERTFGHFVRVLVDIDLASNLRRKVLVERKSFAFFLDSGYENLLDFFNYCNSIGHHVGICRRAKVNVTSNEGENAAKDDNFIRRPGNESFKEPTKDFVQTKDRS